MKKPRCSKCGRVLSNPVSIARGMGPVCAGRSGHRGKGIPRTKSGRSPRRYAATGVGSGQLPLFVITDLPKSKKKKKRPRAKDAKVRRKLLFEYHQPYLMKAASPASQSIVYTPVRDDMGRQHGRSLLLPIFGGLFTPIQPCLI